MKSIQLFAIVALLIIGGICFFIFRDDEPIEALRAGFPRLRVPGPERNWGLGGRHDGADRARLRHLLDSARIRAR